MKIVNKDIKFLLEHYKEISALGKIKAVLDWDLNVNMPPKASEERSKQSAMISKLIVDRWLDKAFVKALKKSSKAKKLNKHEKAIVRNLNYASDYYLKVPKEIIIKKDEVTSKAFVVWKKAREENKFKDFLPYLKEIIEIDKLVAKHLGYKNNPYDALLNLYEPGLTAKKCEEVFIPLRDELIILLNKIKKSKNYKYKSKIDGKRFSFASQKLISDFVAKQMNYDLEAGRIDVSPHPFTTTLGRSDVRITTRYKDNFIESYTATAHETGHALYEQEIDEEFSETPLEGGVSYGIHEALSRFWENMVGKNPNFLQFITPVFKKHFSLELKQFKPEDIIKEVNLVKPSLIRIEADEVTYSLHIIIRFEMENDLINGKIKIEDAAKVWNEKYKKYLGVKSKTDSDGVLQDVHWSYGSFGYFPAYALGNLYGAQFLKEMRKTVNFENDLKKGNLKNIHAWLKDYIHKYGSLYWPHELIKLLTKEDLNPKYFVEYLNNKYKSIYKF